MEVRPKVNCAFCDRAFFPYPVSKIYCCIRCARTAKDRRRAAERKAKKGETLVQRQAKIRYETERTRDYMIGDTVRFRNKVGVVIHKIPAGSSIPVAWQDILNKDPELLPAANSTFASIRATTTPRFFIVCEESGKKRVHCPMLHNIMEKEA